MRDVRENSKSQIGASRISSNDDIRWRTTKIVENVEEGFNTFSNLNWIGGVGYQGILNEQESKVHAYFGCFLLKALPASDMFQISVQRESTTYSLALDCNMSAI